MEQFFLISTEMIHRLMAKRRIAWSWQKSKRKPFCRLCIIRVDQVSILLLLE
jgi:hypothetical protein